MKKLLIFSFIFAMVMLWGCEKESTITPYEPITGSAGKFSVMSNSTEEEQYIAIYSIDGELLPYEDKEFIPLNPGIEHFLTFIVDGIIEGYVTFDTDNHKNAYLNKLDATIKMVTKGNYKGSIMKIEKDLKKKSEEWITGSYPEIVVSLLDIQVYLLENSDVEFNVESSLSWTTYEMYSYVQGPNNPDIFACHCVSSGGGDASQGGCLLYQCAGIHYQYPERM